jgi:hypothetical protein
MNIEMINLLEQPNYIVPESGKYLVRVERKINNLYKTVSFVDIYVQTHYDEKKKCFYNTFDCRGDVTHISKNACL